MHLNALNASLVLVVVIPLLGGKKDPDFLFVCFFQVLKARVNNEVMHFNSYLQDVARMCADDYNFISQGAMQYSEVLILHQLHLSLALCGLVHKQ